MIGIRGVASATLAVAACASAMPAEMDGPGPRIGADRLVVERATAASRALAALEEALAPALEAARRGAARIVTGDEPPAEEFALAADALLDAEDEARAANGAVGTLDAALLARDAGATVVGAPVAGGELASIAGQLDATAEAGNAFAARRHAAEGLTAALERGLAALAAGDLSMAEQTVADARDAHDAVAAWEDPPDALPVWIETTDAMIRAMETILSAMRQGDVEHAHRAAEDVAALEDEAGTADRALRISMSEGGNAVASTALGRLAGVLDAVASARVRVAAVLSSRPR